MFMFVLRLFVLRLYCVCIVLVLWLYYVFIAFELYLYFVCIAVVLFLLSMHINGCGMKQLRITINEPVSMICNATDLNVPVKRWG